MIGIAQVSHIFCRVSRSRNFTTDQPLQYNEYDYRFLKKLNILLGSENQVLEVLHTRTGAACNPKIVISKSNIACDV